MNKRILIAMSGGVDSSLAAYCLREEGYDLRGVFMRFLASGQNRNLERARAVTAKLKIPLYILDLTGDFERYIIKYFYREYLSGRTPNPCIVCNQKIKFRHLLKKAKELKADYVSSGHYARIEYDIDKKRFFLKQGIDKNKDQSYMLFGLEQQWLSRIIFPLGNYTKTEVRALARNLNLKNYNSLESQDVCFIRKDYRYFLKRIYGKEFSSGPIIDKQGNVLGRHKGTPHFTIGQRKGLGVATGRPLYVIRIDSKRNAVFVGDKKEVRQDELSASRLNWLLPESPSFPFRAEVKIRYKNPKSWATVFKLAKDRLRVKFDLPQPAVTPGQAVVFYDQELVLGGGWIE
jgi:tRNA-specific 2-thiouridylase